MPMRMIRPEIARSEKVNRLSPCAETFYWRLLLAVDDYARYHAHPSLLLAACFPLKIGEITVDDVSRYLAECVSAGLVVTYQHEGRDYLEVLQFNQRMRAKTSKFPAPGHGTADCANEHTVDDENNADTCIEGPLESTGEHSRAESHDFDTDEEFCGESQCFSVSCDDVGHVSVMRPSRAPVDVVVGAGANERRKRGGKRDVHGVSNFMDLTDQDVKRIVRTKDREAFLKWDRLGVEQFRWMDSENARVIRAAFWHRAVMKLVRGQVIQNSAAFVSARMKDVDVRLLDNSDFDWSRTFLRPPALKSSPTVTGSAAALAMPEQQRESLDMNRRRQQEALKNLIARPGQPQQAVG